MTQRGTGNGDAALGQLIHKLLARFGLSGYKTHLFMVLLALSVLADGKLDMEPTYANPNGNDLQVLLMAAGGSSMRAGIKKAEKGGNGNGNGGRG